MNQKVVNFVYIVSAATNYGWHAYIRKCRGLYKISINNFDLIKCWQKSEVMTRFFAYQKLLIEKLPIVVI